MLILKKKVKLKNRDRICRNIKCLKNKVLEHTLPINKHDRRLFYLNTADTKEMSMDYGDYLEEK
ncbi:hypothetical protein bcgnr5406_10400 [Bacillus cereus]